MTGAVLVLNAGSSSLKFALYRAEALEPLCRGAVEPIGAKPRFELSGPRTSLLDGAVPPPESGDHEAVVQWLLTALRGRPDLEIAVAGHRVVHGGANFDRPVRVDDAILAELAVIEHVPKLGPIAAYARQFIRDKLIEHKEYICRHGEDMPEIRDWGWPYGTAARAGD